LRAQRSNPEPRRKTGLPRRLRSSQCRRVIFAGTTVRENLGGFASKPRRMHHTMEAFDAALLPSEMRRGGDAIETLQGEDRVGELVGALLQHRAGERQKLLLHRLRVRE